MIELFKNSFVYSASTVYHHISLAEIRDNVDDYLNYIKAEAAKRIPSVTVKITDNKEIVVGKPWYTIQTTTEFMFMTHSVMYFDDWYFKKMAHAANDNCKVTANNSWRGGFVPIYCIYILILTY